MIREIQAQHKLWSLKNFGTVPPKDMLLGIVEEVGELAHAHLKESQNIRMNEDHKQKQIDAVGDIAIYLIGYCNSRDLDLQSIIVDVWNDVKQRDWRKYPENGRTK